MPEPRLLLLDEPAAGLDVAGREQLLASLDDLRERLPDLASVLVTHHLEEVIPEIDRVILLSKGAIFADGPKAEVLTVQRLSALFGLSLQMDNSDGIYSAW